VNCSKRNLALRKMSSMERYRPGISFGAADIHIHYSVNNIPFEQPLSICELFHILIFDNELFI
jgi:hypothetical protein